jgi:hypothetical protein
MTESVGKMVNQAKADIESYYNKVVMAAGRAAIMDQESKKAEIDHNQNTEED